MMQTFELPIHFGNLSDKHAIGAESLTVFIESYQDIFETLFGSKVKVEIGLPEEGGWKTTLKIIGAIGVVGGFVGIDNLSLLVRGKDSSDLFLHANKIVKEFIVQRSTDVVDGMPRKCLEQKNRIFKEFEKDDCIDSFKLGELFPIPRSNFNLYIATIPDEKGNYLGKTNISVSSPDWKGRRSWRGKIEILEDAEVSFDFEKDLTGKFWESVRLDTLPLHTPQDTMSVQLIMRPTERVKYRVVRVLKYNDINIDNPISDNDILKLVDESSKLATRNEVETQLDLFVSKEASP